MEEIKLLKEYTNEELLKVLETNEIENVGTLIGICSEILRRYPPQEMYYQNWVNRETRDWNELDLPFLKDTDTCYDCGVKRGEEHLDNCDIVRCTKCKRQRLTCICEDEE